MSLACLDTAAPGTLKRQIIGKEGISFTGIACYSLSQLKLLSMALEIMLLVDAVAAALCLLISELRGGHSQCQMTPWLPCSPDLSVRFVIAIKSL